MFEDNLQKVERAPFGTYALGLMPRASEISLRQISILFSMFAVEAESSSQIIKNRL